jgi:uncharacterized membrane protein YqjE
VPDDSHAAPDDGIVRQAQLLLAAMLGYFRARLELAGIEGREAGTHWLKVVALLVAGLVALVFGWLFLCLAAVFLIALLCGGGNAWIWITLAMAVLHLGGGAGVLWAVKSMIAHPVFAATMEEFKKDQEWLKEKTAKPR